MRYLSSKRGVQVCIMEEKMMWSKQRALFKVGISIKHLNLSSEQVFFRKVVFFLPNLPTKPTTMIQMNPEKLDASLPETNLVYILKQHNDINKTTSHILSILSWPDKNLTFQDVKNGKIKKRTEIRFICHMINNNFTN